MLLLHQQLEEMEDNVTDGQQRLASIATAIIARSKERLVHSRVINSGKQVVVFLDVGADGADTVPFILPEFQMIWETPFSVTDTSFLCSINCINKPLDTADHMYMINYLLNKNIIPIGDSGIMSDPADALMTNGLDSILANTNGCALLGVNHAPSFILLNFVNIGEGFAAADQLNGL
ncbi:hypothetical protein DFH08DRAFT_812283 [Mycena albidolilacea]|uniref:Uncharacterized protein n=1 Tax=Mycena albidolilacea TaxID=1033008 RepID=A0AAD7EMC5_9AGAR|nr:hypothetical protein DFH08DRAFT_812283 [Mycena albidolilacea]